MEWFFIFMGAIMFCAGAVGLTIVNPNALLVMVVFAIMFALVLIIAGDFSV